MIQPKSYKAFIIFSICIISAACLNSMPGKKSGDQLDVSNSSSLKVISSPAQSDSSTISKAELTRIYSKAIAEFIKAVNQKDKKTFDTLYFGKRVNGQPDDFPDISLPETIENTPIKLISPQQEKNYNRKGSRRFILI